MRQDLKRKNKFLNGLIVVGIVTFLLSLILMSSHSGIAIALFLFSIVYFIVLATYRMKFVNYCKELILVEEFNKYNLNYVNSHKLHKRTDIKNNIFQQEFYLSNIVNKTRGNVFVSNDLVYGEIDGYFFRSIDINCYYTQSTGKSTITITLFKGRFYAVDINADENFELAIRESREKMDYDKFYQIQYESEAFNKKYRCYATNELDAFRYVKPQTIERIGRLEEKFYGQLFIGISGSRLYVGRYDGKDEFETNRLFSQEELNNSIEGEINFIKEMIRIFKNVE